MTSSCYETKSLPNSRIKLLCSAWNLGKENPRNFWKIWESFFLSISVKYDFNCDMLVWKESSRYKKAKVKKEERNMRVLKWSILDINLHIHFIIPQNPNRLLISSLLLTKYLVAQCLMNSFIKDTSSLSHKVKFLLPF